MPEIKAFLGLPLFAIVTGRMGTNRLVPTAQSGSGSFKLSAQSMLAAGKTLVNSKRLSDWTHSTWIPRRAYRWANLFRRSAEE